MCALFCFKTLLVRLAPPPPAYPAFVCGHIKQVRINVVRQQCLQTYYHFSTTQKAKEESQKRDSLYMSPPHIKMELVRISLHC